MGLVDYLIIILGQGDMSRHVIFVSSIGLVVVPIFSLEDESFGVHGTRIFTKMTSLITGSISSVSLVSSSVISTLRSFHNHPYIC